MTKVCSKCGEEKPATTEYFGKDKANKDGLKGQCKNCIKEYQKQYRKENKGHYKQYYEENKEEIKERHKQYHKKNKEKRNEYQKQWRKENKEYSNQYYKENKEYFIQRRKENKEYRKQYYKENKEHYKQYHKENKEKIKERKKKYYKENKEKIKECSNQWRKENINRTRQYKQKRRALKKRLPHTLTLDQWQQIKDDFNNECAYCGKTEQEHKEEFNQQLHQEHFVPLSKGGGYTQNNIIPACRSCNTSKHNTDFFEWYPTYEHYSEEREQFILEYLGYIDDNQQLTFDIEVI